MAASSTVGSKRQIIVPIEVRRRLGVKKGDRVEFVVEDGKTVLRPVQPAVIRSTNLLVLPHFKNIDEINAWVREMRDPEGEYASDQLQTSFIAISSSSISRTVKGTITRPVCLKNR